MLCKPAREILGRRTDQEGVADAILIGLQAFKPPLLRLTARDPVNIVVAFQRPRGGITLSAVAQLP